MARLTLFIVRVLFLSLASFELANLFGILHFTLDFSWLGLALTCLGVWWGLELITFFIKRKYNYTLPVFIFVIPVLVIFVDAFGDILKSYSRFSWYDQVAHFLGGGAAATVLFFIVFSIVRHKKLNLSNRFSGLFAIGWANLLGALYEIEEYAESIFLKNNRLGDRFDTPNDLLCNLAGSVICVFFILLFIKRRLAKKKK
jgi:uncharacterized membrane protein YjdF